MKGLWLALGCLLAAPAMAQDYAEAEGATLRFLDKLTSETGDVSLSRGQAAQFGRLLVRLDSCRYPAENPTSDASAHLTVVEEVTQSTIFTGWMVASSPALSALDHPRYDVWVLSCLLPEAPEGQTTGDE
ncbi:MAG: DUF2155 domain-containing protein [Rhodobacterales bacterium]|nr:MAG: DUF2155 domain-containing protein [Rhodobacterales bacterium]